MAPPKCSSQASLKDKTAVVTGANTGIGLEVAKDLARRGAKVILACRNETRAEAAVAQIVQETGNENVMTLKLDLASLSSVREFSQKVTEGEDRLDILVNNAGICCPQSTTEDGIETQLQVNHLGHFLLTNLLLDLLKKSAPSRVVVVASSVHKTSKGINFEDINYEKDYVAFPVYAQSKLANILFTRELAKRLEGTGVTAYAAHPGLVKTELWRTLPELYGWKFTVFKPMFYLGMAAFAKTPVQGAQTIINCAVEEALSSESGLYYSDCAVEEPSQKAMDDVVARQLWDVSERMTGLSS
ncbi:PREDICTED: retinol dehydrogenase 14-like [Branchiostoma belcheri]|uniref:Retinol dehydrogenase 14-like n=1 Tax=Branchiostoma belcheri TaxID=7741 RepID=A0A6P4ZHL7_BRABE|nr:PREDICTED: retinol dehydrogenase 14-like [Branchiostoma belcheri]KAI8489991.1 hypothetical protein Bbelb_323520 [Branchiostoma belcheri]